MRRTPTVARFLLSAAVLAAPLARGDAQEPGPLALDEAEAVRRALARPALDAQLEAAVDLARADALAARRWPNPEASWSHEQVDGRAGTGREDVVALSQRLDLSGRRDLRGAAARRRVEAARADAARARLEVEADTRLAFVAVLALERRAAAVRAVVARVEAIAGAVALRAARGDVAGYDRRRVERERLALLARLDAEEGSLARARALLAALVGASDPPSLELRGDLAPLALPALEALLERVEARSDLRSLALDAESGELEARAAGRWFVPEVELGGGIKIVDAGGRRDTGFAAAVTIPLPVLTRDRAERVRGEARARAARAALALALDEARAEVAGRHAEASRLEAAAARYARSEDADGSALVAAAEAGYRGGEVGVLELVDAYRSSLDASVALVDLQAAARRARIDLDRASGGSVR